MYAFREAHQKKDAREKVDLRSKSGERVIAGRRAGRSAVTETELRRQLNRDLESLLNTTNLDSAQNLEDFPAVARSILNFGIPELSRVTIDELPNRNLATEIRDALFRYEPRLIRNTIRVSRNNTVSAETLGVRFQISAEMSCEPVAVPVEFVADLDIANNKVLVGKL